ncbi:MULTISPECIES: hypothetical protein [Aromatoleum]|uniref:Transposase n=2 Tax=Aromatoleum TaxID=551759 RepID=A0ABX1P1D0_9RHOO|nr:MULTISPECIES: hypothetical protein [Aromatoleum]NMG17801.1 transposase [Aromatoleum bremense]NMG56716.1 transposase [Aromatoleum aromaticum]CAI06976.1 hypothetical transposase [Aromatoleum aromaticum EbN1]
MTRPRSTLVSVSDTPWYHVVSRCVRRAFLCGTDAHSGQCFEHRRGWIVERVKQLVSVFAIDVAAYAVMSNHYHLVLRIDAERARSWSRDEVLRRWTQLFDGPLAVQRLLAGQGDELDAGTHLAIDDWAEKYRARLYDLSWFMRVLNETLARKANTEDEVTGRFWEGRFRSQALLDEHAILAAMVYVDLNPIRAQMAETPEESEHTSVAERIAALKPARQRRSPAPRNTQPPAPAPQSATPIVALKCEAHLARLPQQPLMPFDATARLKAAIPFAFDDYLELLDSTGRSLRPDKRGAISSTTPAVLNRLNIDPERFIDCATHLMQQFGSAVGAPAHLTALCAARQVKYLRGIATAKRAFAREAA